MGYHQEAHLQERQRDGVWERVWGKVKTDRKGIKIEISEEEGGGDMVGMEGMGQVRGQA